MESKRPQRVADLLLHEIAEILQKEVRDPRVGFVTVTGVEVSADLRVARVYYTVLGEATRRKETDQGLKSACPFVRREVGRRLRLKAVPELRFLYDESIDRGLRLQEILEGIRHGSEEPDR